MPWGASEELWVVNTRFCCLCTLDRSDPTPGRSVCRHPPRPEAAPRLMKYRVELAATAARGFASGVQAKDQTDRSDPTYRSDSTIDRIAPRVGPRRTTNRSSASGPPLADPLPTPYSLLPAARSSDCSDFAAAHNAKFGRIIHLQS
jgi:hypothetical protein